jgi:hypothetical protein
MELLKFSDSPKSSRRGKNPAAFIGAGIMVAVMGLSSTLAGTISINSGATVEFGQGIVSTAACDNSINITPTSSYSFGSNAFTVSSIELSNIGWDSSTSVEEGQTQTINERHGRGCRGQVLELRAFDAEGDLRLFHSDSASTYALTVFIPNDSAAAESFVQGLYDVNLSSFAISGDDRVRQPGLAKSGPMVGAFANATGNSAMTITVSGLKLSSEVVRLTLESRRVRALTDEDGNKSD